MSRHRQSGFTLVETLLAISIGALIMGALVTALFQVSEVTRAYQDTLDTRQQLQVAASMLNHDVVSAVGGAVSPGTLTLTIPEHSFGQDMEPVTHTITYLYVQGDGTLVRNDDQGDVAVARHLTGVVFSIDSSGIVSASITVTRYSQVAHTTLAFHRRPGD